MSVIKFEHVDAGYDANLILEDFNLTIEKGEFITVIGGSGSGKTTALKLINGLLKARKGHIYVNEEDVAQSDLTNLRRNIGYVIQNIGLFSHMTIERNIAYVLELMQENKEVRQARVAELMQIVDLENELKYRYPDELSGGQKQRVGIARALAAKPNILLMDEPFGAVDEITRRLLQDELLKIFHQLDITIFFITHDIHEAMRLGTRVLVMKDGKIEQFDTPNNLKKNPQTKFVEELLSYLKE